MFDVFAITLYYVFKATPPFADKVILVTASCCHAATIALFRSFTDLEVETSAQCSGKPFPQVLPSP